MPLALALLHIESLSLIFRCGLCAFSAYLARCEQNNHDTFCVRWLYGDVKLNEGERSVLGPFETLKAHA